MAARLKFDRDGFESAMRIAEFCIRQFNERRDYSWKISLGFWGAIIGSFAVGKEYVQSIPDNLCLRFFIFIFVVVVGVIIICLHHYWLENVAKADKLDKDLAFEARDLAIIFAQLKLINVPSPKYKTREVNKSVEDYIFPKDWSFQFQYLVTTMLIVIAEAINLLYFVSFFIGK